MSTSLAFIQGEHMHALAAITIGVGTLTGSVSDRDPFIQNIHSKVIETIAHSEDVPGLKG